MFGVFDLFHVGHWNALKYASERCDILIVGIFSDASVKKYKEAPIFTENVRLLVVNESGKNLPTKVKPFIVERNMNWSKNIPILSDVVIDVFFVSEDHRGKKLKCVPKRRYKDIVWIPYTEGISTTVLRKHYGL